MTQEELLNKINGTANGDNAADVLAISDEVKGLYSQLDAANKQAEEDKALIEKVKADNTALYKRITSTTPETPPEENKETYGVDWDDFFSKASGKEE